MDSELRELLFTALGEASMCWSKTPSSVFESIRCKEIGERVVSAFDSAAEKVEGVRERAPNSQSMPPCPQCQSLDTGYRCCACGTEFGADDD
jgi:hypothetical protein